MEPLAQLDDWLAAARAGGEPLPQAMALATVSEDGMPSIRTVSLKELDTRGLVFTTGLGSRKALDLARSGRAAACFWWPLRRRQVRVAGVAERLARADEERLFAERPRAHRLQTLVSRQGEPIEDLAPLRERMRELDRGPLACPADFGGFRLVPDLVEFWEERPDRLHERIEHRRGERGWTARRLAP